MSGDPRIRVLDALEIGEAEFWAHHRGGKPTLPPVPEPCHDCAISTGFYLELAESLSRQPAEVIADVSARWFCHNCPGRACKGNLDYQEGRSA